MEISPIDTASGSSIAYSVATAGLNIGPEIEWDPDHLVLSAWTEHVPFAFWLMKVLRPDCFVELGTERGVSYAAFCQAVDRLGVGARCYAVDTWRGDEHAGHYDESVYHQIAEVNDRRYRRFSSLLRSTFADALPYFSDGEIDLLHIDGLHTYDAVAEDFRTWRPKLSGRAVVLFHDTNVRRDDFGVWRLWQALAAEFPHFEFVHGHGLGVIGVGENLPEPVRTLFGAYAQDDRRVAVRALFAARGKALQRAFDLQCAHQQAANLSGDLAAQRHESATLHEHAAALRQQIEAEQAASRHSQALAEESLAKVAASQAAAEESLAKVAASQAEAESLRQQLTETAGTIESLQKKFDAATAEIADLNRSVVAKVAEARNEQAKRSNQVAEAAAQEVIAQLKTELAAAQAWSEALVGSTSWKVTAPLRAVKIAMARQQEAGSAPVSLVRRLGGGPRNGTSGAADGAPAPALISRDRILPPKAQADLLRLRVLIVAELSLAQCKKYRVDQKHDMIEALGWDCTVVGWPDTDRVISLMHTHSMVIFYRVPAFPDAIRCIEEAKALGLPRYFELDDLIFDIDDYAANPNLGGLDPATAKGLFDGAILYRRALELCGNVIASTPYLAERMQAAGGGSATVVENALDAETMRTAAKLQRRRQDGKVRILYGSGTRTHDADFALVTPALERVAAEHTDVEIMLVGELSPPKSLLALGDRLQQLPACPYVEYLALLAASDIAIAPLSPVRFNEAKSNIKFLEAAAVGVPSVCSPRSAFAHAIRPGETGFLAESVEEWYRTLSALVVDAALRERVGRAAQADIQESYGPDAIGRRQVQPLLARHVPAADPRLHILQVNILFRPQSFGGATIVMEELTRQLSARADTRVSVCTSAPAGWLKPYAVERGDDNGVPIFRIGIQDRAGWLEEAWDEKAAEAFRDVLRISRPDVVHFHAIQGLGAGILEVCREEGIPFAVTLHDAWWLCERQFLVTGEGKYCGQQKINLNVCANCVNNIGTTVIRNLRLRGALQHADLLLTPSQHWRRFYLANGFAPERVLANENGIPLPTDPVPNQGPAKLRFGFVAGAEAVKGFPLLKRTFEALKRDDWELVLVNHGLSVGIDSYAGVKWNARGTITVIPPYKEQERDGFYASIDVLLFPSQWPESFGLTVREALTRNKWVIATDRGGAAEAIQPGVNGTLIPIGDDIAPFRQAVEALLDRKPNLAGWVNPSAGRIRDFATQADELRDMLASVADRSSFRAGGVTSQAAD
jgi:O-antigen biosynthesis protein